LEGKWGEENLLLTLVNVYSSCVYSEKKIMWEELLKCRRDDENKVWCMIGDFNAVRKPDERKGLS